MKKTVATLILTIFFLTGSNTPYLFCQGNEMKEIEEAKSADAVKGACEAAISKCASYEDYEKLVSQIKGLIAKSDYPFADVLNYTLAKARVDELSFLTKENTIDSGRIYMSVNEKYYNEALECLDNADKAAKTPDLRLETSFIRFLIFKEMLQPQKADAVFNEMVNKVVSYSEDSTKNIAKLYDMSNKLIQAGMGDHAMKLRLEYASKADSNSAKMIVDGIKTDADKYFEEGNARLAASTYDTYLKVAENYYDKDAVAARLMDIGEKYFNKNRYKESAKYYSLYLSKYGSSQMADYAGYRLALSFYNDKDYAKAIGKFEEFLNAYPNSVWFEKVFESLCRLYYETSQTDEAINKLQKLTDAYQRRDTIDYAYLLIGILYYSSADYDKALGIFNKIEQEFPKSAYIYTADTLIAEINSIKKAGKPSYSFGSKNGYKMWEPYTSINADVEIDKLAQIIENKDAKPGEIFLKTKAGSKLTFTLKGLEDLDRFNEYLQDKDDPSRLPRELRAETEKDLLFFNWTAGENSKFLDDKQALSRTWEAPDQPGEYTITINIGDLALVRPPDTGSRKDPVKTILIHATVEK